MRAVPFRLNCLLKAPPLYVNTFTIKFQHRNFGVCIQIIAMIIAMILYFILYKLKFYMTCSVFHFILSYCHRCWQYAIAYSVILMLLKLFHLWSWECLPFPFYQQLQEILGLPRGSFQKHMPRTYHCFFSNFIANPIHPTLINAPLSLGQTPA